MNEPSTNTALKILGFMLICLAVLNNMLSLKSGTEVNPYLNMALLGGGAILYFSARLRQRKRQREQRNR